jgi:hypothetical protein
MKKKVEMKDYPSRLQRSGHYSEHYIDSRKIQSLCLRSTDEPHIQGNYDIPEFMYEASIRMKVDLK